MQKKALGRGLDALIGDGVAAPIVVHPPPAAATVAYKPLGTSGPPAATASPADGVRQIEVTAIERNRYQPRVHFDPEHLNELAESIRQRGVMQPLLVRPLPNGRYELIAGERRWRAAQAIGLSVVPALVRDASDEEALEIALIENLQREDLNPIEEARAYEQLAGVFHLTQEQIAERVGKNRATIANALRLLSLPADVIAWVGTGQLSVGHAKAILGARPEEQKLVAERVLRRGLTVRQTEELVNALRADPTTRARALSGTAKSAHVLAIEEALRQKLGTQVNVRHGKRKGRIEIEYYGNDELARLLDLLGVETP